MWVILLYTPFFLRYPLISNLLYQVSKTSHLMISSSYCTVSTLICDCSFVTFGGSLIFFSYYVVPTSHVIVLLSHLMVLLFFFLIFDDSILTLCNSNITCDCFFVTFGGSLFFFSHIWWFHYLIRQHQYHIGPYFCHI